MAKSELAAGALGKRWSCPATHRRRFETGPLAASNHALSLLLLSGLLVAGCAIAPRQPSADSVSL
jgi:hypothetical protein